MAKEKDKKILVINDSETLNTFLKVILSNAGFNVEFSLTGSEGICKFILMRYNLILLDYNLPDMTGVEVCKKIREKESSTSIPIAFITGVEEELIADDIGKAGANAYIHPPYKGKEFIDILMNLIEK